jgi:hypothetical protein
LSLLAFLVKAMNQLDITYHNTYNCKTLKIEDNSIYDTTQPIKNVILEIKSPGLTSFVPFYFPNEKWKAITLNCSSLKICCGKKVSTLSVLPDGIYNIKYSVDPNLTCMVEFNHMRVCQIMSRYIKILGIFLSNKCSMTNKEIEQIEKELLEIKDTIDSSIYAVEERLDSALGLELYNEAINRLNKINDGDFTSCCK